MSTASTSCEHCGAAIAKDDVAQGLAVRVDGKLTCADCVDALPGEAVVRINRLRALRGLGHTTYALPRPKHPQLVGYTFTTAAMIAHHRRQLQQRLPFEAPPLPAALPPLPVPAMARPKPYPSRPGAPSPATVARRLRIGIAASVLAVAGIAVAAGLLLGRGAGRE